MFDRIIRFSIQNKLIISLGVGALILFGIYSFSQLPIDAVPDITDNQVQVITTSPHLAAQEVEQLITFPLELELGNLPGLEEIRSVSRFGLSVITLVFEESMDSYLARQLIGEQLQKAQNSIPSQLGIPSMGPITTGLGEVYQYVLYPAKGYEDTYTATDLRTIQDWIVKRQLVGIKGVIEVNSSGGLLKQYEVAVNPEKLKSMNISLAEVFTALQRNNSNTGGSYIEKDPYAYFIRGEGRFTAVKEIELVHVKTKDGLPILIQDVATVQIGSAPRFGAVTMNSIGEVVAGQVLMLKGENAAAVTQRVKDRMKQIAASLPEGIKIEPYLDRTKLVNQTTQTVATNLIEGGLIVIFVLVLLLGNVRAGLIVASVIPLSMLFAAILMNLFGVTANLMSLGAIDFGLIVDGAVIIVEAITHHLGLRKASEKLSQLEIDAEVAFAAGKTRKAAAFGEIIILMVYLPILFLTGVEGKMFKPMVQTVSFAILGALLLSLTYVPMISSVLLGKSKGSTLGLSDKIIGTLQRLYQPILHLGFRFKGIFVALTLLLFGLSLFTLSNMGGEFIPTLEEGDFALHQILPPGSSLSKGVEVSAELQRILMERFPEVEKVVTKIGTAEIPTDLMPVEAGDIYVIMKPKKEWVSAKSREEMFEKMEEALKEYPGVIYEFTQPIQMRFNELMTGIRQDIAIKIYGEDLGVLAQKAKEAKSIIEGINGIGDLQVEPTGGLLQMVVNYDRLKLATYGLQIEDLNTIVRTSFGGEKAGYFYEGEKRFEVVARLDASRRTEIEDLKKLNIPLENGFQVPLEELGTVRFEEGPSQISRDNTQRRITLGVNARGRDVQSLVTEIQEEISEKLALDPGYYVTYGGQFENFRQARDRLLVVVPIALFLIFILLFFTFNSIWQALIIFTAIPMSAIGGIWSLYLRGMPFSISAGVGFIALFGVSVLNGIVLISYFNQLKREGITDLMERIHTGTRLRFRPVLMTALVASLGFLPMAFSSASGAEVQRPLATVVIGGLITSTFLTLVILPILYYFLERRLLIRGSNLVTMMIVLLGVSGSAFAQYTPISLEEAITLAKENHPLMDKAQLKTEQFKALSQGSSVAQQNKTSLFFSTEEYDFEPNTGIHSFGFFQNFNLPQVNSSYRRWQRAQMNQSIQEKNLLERELVSSLTQVYSALIFWENKHQLYEEFAKELEEFERITRLRFAAGESGKIPQLLASSKKKSIQLLADRSRQEWELARNAFNNWLFTDQLYETAEDTLAIFFLPDLIDSSQHPVLLIQEEAIEVSNMQIQVRKSQQLPQLQLGGQLQRVAGSFPFFGYQFGLNIPLLQKGYKAQIRAAESQQKQEQANLVYERERVALKQTAIEQKLRQNLVEIAIDQEELLPASQEQRELSREAYRQGEITYAEYILSLEMEMETRLNALERRYQHHLLMAEWQFWN